MNERQARIAAEMALVAATLDGLLEREPALSPGVRRMVAQWRGVAAGGRGRAEPSLPRPPPDGDPRDLDHIV